MVDDQLAATTEEVGERLFTVRSIETVGLFDLSPKATHAAAC